MHRDAKDFALAMGGTAGLALGQVVFAVLTTRWLTPDERGVLIVFLSLANLLAFIATMGVGVEGRRRLVSGDDSVLRLYRSVVLLVIPVGALLTLTLGTAVVLATSTYQGPWTLVLVAAATVSQAVSLLARDGMYGTGRFAAVAYAFAAGSVLQVVGVIGLHVANELTLTTAMLLFIATSALPALSLWRLLFPRWHGQGRPATKEVLALAVRSLPAVPGVLSQQIFRSGDRLLLGVVATPAAVATYGAGAALAMLPNLIGLASGQVVQTRAAEDPARQAARHERVTLMLTAAAAIGLAALSPWLVPLLFGQAYEDAVPVAQLSLAAAFFMSANRLQLSAHQGKGMHRAVTVSTAVGALTMTVLVLWWGSLWGASGAAAAMLVVSLELALTWRLIGRAMRDHDPDPATANPEGT